MIVRNNSCILQLSSLIEPLFYISKMKLDKFKEKHFSHRTLLQSDNLNYELTNIKLSSQRARKNYKTIKIKQAKMPSISPYFNLILRDHKNYIGNSNSKERNKDRPYCSEGKRDEKKSINRLITTQQINRLKGIIHKATKRQRYQTEALQINRSKIRIQFKRNVARSLQFNNKLSSRRRTEPCESQFLPYLFNVPKVLPSQRSVYLSESPEQNKSHIFIKRNKPFKHNHPNIKSPDQHESKLQGLKRLWSFLKPIDRQGQGQGKIKQSSMSLKYFTVQNDNNQTIRTNCQQNTGLNMSTKKFNLIPLNIKRRLQSKSLLFKKREHLARSNRPPQFVDHTINGWAISNDNQY